MIGWICRHPQLGVGKIVGAERQGTVRIRYLDGDAELIVSRSALDAGVLARVALPPGSRCMVGEVACTVERLGEGGGSEPFRYHVQQDDGSPAVVSEVDLVPLPGEAPSDPLGQLAAADPHPYDLFSAREWLVRSHARVVRDAGGFRALLSSRIDLRPHQAYVAGVVTSDWRRRYILADEVGLGKTIEAGIVIHELLLQKPGARILVICPGELTQQWLCELFSRFGGHVFKLLDLHAPESLRPAELRKAIVSTTLAGFRLAGLLRSVPWDLVVVDEAHHLLHAPHLYALAERLSRAAPSLLLLSALPAQRREDEFLRLLRLLEPERYGDDADAAAARFRALHAVQRDVGVRMHRLSARAAELRAGEVERDDLLRVARRLLDIPALARDAWLRSLADGLAARSDETALADGADEVVAYVADHYRVNRRLLRNRRHTLAARGELAPVERRLASHPYLPGQLELDATRSVVDLLREARGNGLDPAVHHAAGRVFLQSLASPAAAHKLLDELHRAAPSAVADDVAYAAAGALTGYAEWPAYRRVLCGVLRPCVDGAAVAGALERLRAWQQSARASARHQRLLDVVAERGAAEPRPKLLVFAGFPGLCAEMAAVLAAGLGPGAVREFRHDLSREQKEANVHAFATDAAVWVLVSDETGGEGRNFQFVDEIIHADTPWSVVRVEQRIGRLDRIGRDAVRPDVLSHVIAAEGSPEAGLVHCYAEGIRVYETSISGLEFALRDAEAAVLGAALADGYEAICDLAPGLRTRLEQERARDDDEALIDQASFNRAAAERLQRVTHSAEAEDQLEHSFVRYLQAVSSRRAARPADDQRHPEGVWTFHPDEFRHGVLPRAGEGQEELFRKARGTFRRGIAQARPDLEFFSAGHPLFDAIVRSLSESVIGRTYALSCSLNGHRPWTGFEFVFRAEPAWGAIAGWPGLADRAAMPFIAPPIHLFVGCDGVPLADADALNKARRGLRMPDRDRTWVDVPGPRLLNALRDRMGAGWQGALLRMHDTARERAREHFAARLRDALADEHARIAESLRQIAIRAAAESGEAESLEALRATLDGWAPVLDAAGFLAVNAGRA
jgi:ATP-dependent helicase HepA